MPIRRDRRTDKERRSNPEPQEPIERQGAERRQEDRRASVRAVRKVMVVVMPSGEPREVKADLSLEGAQFTLGSPPAAPEMEVRFRLPEIKDEVRVTCTVQRTAPAGNETSVHVRFGELDVRTELALARLLDFEERLEESLSEDGEPAD
jgi:hypothetical protein